MRTIQFRPLRRVKKTGKIVVASYREWNKLMTANYSEYLLKIDPEYRSMPHDEFVHNHQGEILYFYRYNPNDIPVFSSKELDYAHAMFKVMCIDFGDYRSYSGIGIDCQGTPTFSHFDADYLGTHGYDPNEFEPLTVGKVLEWYEWFIYRLGKATITCK